MLASPYSTTHDPGRLAVWESRGTDNRGCVKLRRKPAGFWHKNQTTITCTNFWPRFRLLQGARTIHVHGTRTMARTTLIKYYNIHVYMLLLIRVYVGIYIYKCMYEYIGEFGG